MKCLADPLRALELPTLWVEPSSETSALGSGFLIDPREQKRERVSLGDWQLKSLTIKGAVAVQGCRWFRKTSEGGDGEKREGRKGEEGRGENSSLFPLPRHRMAKSNTGKRGLFG